MKGKDTAVKERAKEWLRHADDDLRLARVAFKLKSAVPYKLIAYHAQQCAEKCFKAYLVFRKIDFPYTHDLDVLLKQFPDDTQDWVAELQDAIVLAGLRHYHTLSRARQGHEERSGAGRDAC